MNITKQETKEKEIKRLYQELLTDPIKFASWVSGFKEFDQYQVDIIKDEGKRISIRSGRQIGKSTTIALKYLYKAFTRAKRQILILAPSQRQSSLLFNKIREFAHSKDLIASDIERETLTMIKFKDTGSEIHCLPSGYTGATFRGYSPSDI